MEEFDVVLLTESDSYKIFKYIEDINTEDGAYVNQYIKFDEYYTRQNIRERKYNFTEEYLLIKESNKNDVGIISFSNNYDNSVLTINLIYIQNNDKQIFRKLFPKIVDTLRTNIIKSIFKIRVCLVNEENFTSTWEDIFLNVGFVVEAERRDINNIGKVCTDYVYFLSREVDFDE